MTGYVPDEGDIVWLDFDPQAGHEQAGNRPALVLSPRTYNGMQSLMLCCPMTTKIKGHPWEVPLHAHPNSVVLADQVKSLDWRACNAEKKGTASLEELIRVRKLAKALIGKSL